MEKIRNLQVYPFNTLKGHSKSINWLHFDANNNRLLSKSEDNYNVLWKEDNFKIFQESQIFLKDKNYRCPSFYEPTS